MSREEKLRELAEQEQALMREIYGFDNGVRQEREQLLEKLKYKREMAVQRSYGQPEPIWSQYIGLIAGLDQAIALIKGGK